MFRLTPKFQSYRWFRLTPMFLSCRWFLMNR
jgi:hypothetical protein